MGAKMTAVVHYVKPPQHHGEPTQVFKDKMGSLAHKINLIFLCTEQIRWCGVYSKCLFFPPLELHSLVPLQRPPLERTQPDPGYAPSGA